MANVRKLVNGSDELRSAANNISNLATEFFKNYEGMYSTIENDLATVWVGSGADEFKANAENMKGHFEALHELMNEYSSQLINVANSYDSQEADIISAVSTLSFD